MAVLFDARNKNMKVAKTQKQSQKHRNSYFIIDNHKIQLCVAVRPWKCPYSLWFIYKKWPYSFWFIYIRNGRIRFRSFIRNGCIRFGSFIRNVHIQFGSFIRNVRIRKINNTTSKMCTINSRSFIKHFNCNLEVCC